MLLLKYEAAINNFVLGVDFVSQPSPEFLFCPEEMDYAGTSWPPTPFPPPEFETFQSHCFPWLMDDDWTFNDAEVSNFLGTPANIKTTGGDAGTFFDLGNIPEQIDFSTSSLFTACQWSLDSTPFHTPSGEHSLQPSSDDVHMSLESSRRGSQASSPGSGNSPSPTKDQTLSESSRFPENQTSLKKSEMAVILAAKSILRADYLEYLEAELPRWAKGGLWDHGSGNNNRLVTADSDYYDLQIAYSDVCQLHTWIEDDVIRSRMALIRLHLEYLRACEGWQKRRVKGRIGRGDATCIIDHILQKAHHDWPTLSKAQCSTLRTRFHERKRYGKRWAVLADELGKSILFLCAPKVAAIV